MVTTAKARSRTEFIDGLVQFGNCFRATELAGEAMSRSLDAITDTLGCIALGANQPLEPRLRRGLFGEATIEKILDHLQPVNLAPSMTDVQGSLALYLGTLAHAADYDDISHPAYCHATASLLPPLLVRALATGSNGLTLIRAHVVGIETLGQLGRRLNTAHYEKGWHTTGTFGAIGATAALCFLEGFSDEATRRAIGISASLASGVRQNFGTMTKPLHAGLAGRAAILATRLAASEFTCAEDAIEGKFGFMKVYGGHAAESLRKPWGEPLEILTETGIGLKAYPCCAATHPAIDAVRKLRDLIGGAIDEIKSVRVGASKFAMQPLVHDVPATGLEGKFSMRYCVGAALCDGIVKAWTFEPEAIAREDIRAMMNRITVEIDPRVEDDHEFAAIVDVTLKSGRRESVRIDVASGQPGNWLSEALLREKFRDCVMQSTHDHETARALYEGARALPWLARIDGVVLPLMKAIIQGVAHATPSKP